MSLDQVNLAVLAAAGVLVAGMAAVRVSTRSGMPGLLLFLLIGLAMGESGLGLQFSDTDLALTIGTLLLAVILVDGGFTTHWPTIRPVVGIAAVLASAGVLISIAVTAALSHLLLGVDARTALLLGAVASSTDAAATFAILRRLPMRARVRALLEAESGFNDPPVIIIVAVVASDAWFTASPAMMALEAGYQLAVGALVGLVVARTGQWLLQHSALPASGLYPLAMLSITMVAFAGAGLLNASGLLACYVTGLWLANAPLPHRQVTQGFTESLAWLAQIALFVMLGLLASPQRLPDAILPALIVGSALTFVARPLSVLLCTTPFRLPWREQVFASWAGLRGAVPIVLASIPMSVGIPAAEGIFDTVFLLVVVFTLVQGPLLPAVARRTGVIDPAALLDVQIESAPLEDLAVYVVQIQVPPGSRLSGLYLEELGLPTGAVVALIVRGDEVFVPEEQTTLRGGDHLLLAVHESAVEDTEKRLRALGRRGRLATWFGERGEVER